MEKYHREFVTCWKNWKVRILCEVFRCNCLKRFPPEELSPLFTLSSATHLLHESHRTTARHIWVQYQPSAPWFSFLELWNLLPCYCFLQFRHWMHLPFVIFPSSTWNLYDWSLRLEVFTVVGVKIWPEKLRSVVLQEPAASIIKIYSAHFLWIIGTYLQNYIVSHSRRQ